LLTFLRPFFLVLDRGEKRRIIERRDILVKREGEREREERERLEKREEPQGTFTR